MEEVVAGYIRCATAGMLSTASDGNAMALALRVLDLQGELEAQGVEPVYIGGELEPEQALQLSLASVMGPLRCHEHGTT